jgi:hypothetical protein
MALGDKRRNGFGWLSEDPWAGLTGSAGPYNPSGGSRITGGASGVRDGQGTVSGSAGAYDPFPWITGEAGRYDPSREVTGNAGAYDPFPEVTGSIGPYYSQSGAGDENQLSYSQFFARSNLLGGGGTPDRQTNWTPYITVGLLALVVVVALKK